MTTKRIVLAGGDKDLVDLVTRGFAGQGEVVSVPDARHAIACVLDGGFTFLVLAWNVPYSHNDHPCNDYMDGGQMLVSIAEGAGLSCIISGRPEDVPEEYAGHAVPNLVELVPQPAPVLDYAMTG